MGVWKTKQNKKNTQEEIEFHNSIQNWVLVPFTGCRKVPGKIPAYYTNFKSSK